MTRPAPDPERAEQRDAPSPPAIASRDRASDSRSEKGPRVVLCMKWGDKYGPDYVNRLYAMVRRHLRGDFAFVCLTDSGVGIRPEVRCLPIPDLALPAGLPERGWKKLTTFEADLHGLRGTALFLDIDIVIVDDITPFFELPGDFLIIHDWKRPWRVTGNSSVYRFELGTHADVLATFRADASRLRAQYRNEQAYLSARLHAQGKLRYWPDAWCASFKYHAIATFPLNYFRRPIIPAGARIVVFHGVVNPPDALAGRSGGNWRRTLATPWIADHWHE